MFMAILDSTFPSIYIKENLTKISSHYISPWFDKASILPVGHIKRQSSPTDIFPAAVGRRNHSPISWSAAWPKVCINYSKKPQHVTQITR